MAVVITSPVVEQHCVVYKIRIPECPYFTTYFNSRLGTWLGCYIHACVVISEFQESIFEYFQVFQFFVVKTYSIENVATNDTVFSNNRKSNCEIVNSTCIFACRTGKIYINVSLTYYTFLQRVCLFPIM